MCPLMKNRSDDLVMVSLPTVIITLPHCLFGVKNALYASETRSGDRGQVEDA